jgi:cupin fold WbuC family metalloprotein
MLVITTDMLDDLTAQARANPRLRKNLNFHPHDDFPAHRLLNAMEPGSYLRPHRHLDPLKDESFLVLRGRLGVVTFADDGTVTGAVALEPGGASMGVDLPSGCWHTAVSLAAGTVFFETKAGPYRPLTAAEVPAWAPADGDAGVADYLAALCARFRG